MRRIKAIPALVVGLIAVGALAAPAVASANLYWAENGAPLSKPANVELGNGKFTITLGADLSCPVTGKATLGANSDKGEITLSFVTSECKTLGTWETCKVTSATSPFPFSMQLKSKTEVVVSSFNFIWKFSDNGGQCPIAGKQWSVTTKKGSQMIGVLETFKTGFIESLQFVGEIDIRQPNGWLTTTTLHASPMAFLPSNKYTVLEGP